MSTGHRITPPPETISMRFAVPYTTMDDYADVVVDPFAPWIAEVYLALHWSACDTGRPWRGPQRRRAYYDLIARLDERLRPHRIPITFVGNHLKDETEWARVVDEVLTLHEEFPTALYILSSLNVAHEVHKEAPDIDLSPSTFCEIDQPAGARHWIDLAGSKTITLSRKISRTPSAIRHIRKLGVRIRMVLSDECLPSCQLLPTHLAAQRTGDAHTRLLDGADVDCLNQCRYELMGYRSDKRWLLAQSTILPGHLPHLEGLLDIAKLSGRTFSSQKIAQDLARTIQMKTLEQDRRPRYREPPEAWDMLARCDRVCEACGWCPKHIEILDS